MPRPTGGGRVSHPERTLFSSFLPTAAFHNHADQDADRLAKPLAATRMDAS
jgi:hypothetical protein